MQARQLLGEAQCVGGRPPLLRVGDGARFCERCVEPTLRRKTRLRELGREAAVQPVHVCGGFVEDARVLASELVEAGDRVNLRCKDAKVCVGCAVEDLRLRVHAEAERLRLGLLDVDQDAVPARAGEGVVLDGVGLLRCQPVHVLLRGQRAVGAVRDGLHVLARRAGRDRGARLVHVLGLAHPPCSLG
ncbi:hypothetical protein T492DRAFT_1065189 [Pavlovales sp. CCMP2436]|nr:hypothetical protein T492DRAFT_1065189 [Pavlovales sp. CCMP2436]